MSVALCVRVVHEELPEISRTEVSHHVLLLVDDATTQRLLVLLTLEYLLFYAAGLQCAICNGKVCSKSHDIARQSCVEVP